MAGPVPPELLDAGGDAPLAVRGGLAPPAEGITRSLHAAEQREEPHPEGVERSDQNPTPHVLDNGRGACAVPAVAARPTRWLRRPPGRCCDLRGAEAGSVVARPATVGCRPRPRGPVSTRRQCRRGAGWAARIRDEARALGQARWGRGRLQTPCRRAPRGTARDQQLREHLRRDRRHRPGRRRVGLRRRTARAPPGCTDPRRAALGTVRQMPSLHSASRWRRRPM
jgi:hypothetical protein